MKDPHSVLRKKEQDLERVRKEIQALLAAIPLLADDPPFSVMHELLLTSSRTPLDAGQFPEQPTAIPPREAGLPLSAPTALTCDALVDLILRGEARFDRHDGMADLECYYPFIRHLRMSERAR